MNHRKNTYPQSFFFQKIAQTLNRRISTTEILKARERIMEIKHEQVMSVRNTVESLDWPSSPAQLKHFLYQLLLHTISYRMKMPVHDWYSYYDTSVMMETGAYLCPRCQTPIEFDFSEYCSSCGQHLDWDDVPSDEWDGWDD